MLCAVEICGLYYILSVFFELRSNKMYCRVLLGITAVLLCYLTIFQREVGGMYSRYYMFLCIFLAICVAKIFFRVHIIKCLLDIILYFESIYFLDIFWDILDKHYSVQVNL